MSIDAIRMFPMVIPSGYPQEYDLIERRMEKKLELERAQHEQKKAQIAIEDLAFEIYSKNAAQNKLSFEIFENRKLDLYV